MKGKDIMEEIWKDIEGYEGRYQVSNLGRVKTLHNTPHIMFTYEANTGYLTVDLYNGKKRKHFYIHRLVAAAFIPNPDKLPQVNHIDENTYNNTASNLEWCSQQYNIKYGNKGSGFKPVCQYTLDKVLVRKYNSINQAAKYNDILPGGVCNCCKHRTNTYKGYIWRYDV